jgi:hypothetical protein
MKSPLAMAVSSPLIPCWSPCLCVPGGTGMGSAFPPPPTCPCPPLRKPLKKSKTEKSSMTSASGMPEPSPAWQSGADKESLGCNPEPQQNSPLGPSPVFPSLPKRHLASTLSPAPSFCAGPAPDCCPQSSVLKGNAPPPGDLDPHKNPHLNPFTTKTLSPKIPNGDEIESSPHRPHWSKIIHSTQNSINHPLNSIQPPLTSNPALILSSS